MIIKNKVFTFLSLLAMCLLAVTIVSCGDDDEEDNNPKQSGTSFKVDPTQLSFKAEGERQSITFTSEGYKYWGAYVEEDDAREWLSVVSKSWPNYTFEAKPNNTGQTRSAHIIAFVTNEEGELESLAQTKYTRIAVTQPSTDSAPINIKLEMESLDLDYNSEGMIVKYESDVRHTVREITLTSDVDWINTENYSKSDAWFEVRTSQNYVDHKTETQTRTGHVKVTVNHDGRVGEATLTVTQKGYTPTPEFDYEQFRNLMVVFSGTVKLTRTWLDTGEEEHLDWHLSSGYFIPNDERTTKEKYLATNPWKTVVSPSGKGMYLESRWDSTDGLDHYVLTAEIDDVINGRITKLTVDDTSDNDDGSYVHTSITATNVPLPDADGHTTASKENGSSITVLQTTHDAMGMGWFPTGGYGKVHISVVVNGVANDDWGLSISFVKKKE